MGNETHPRLDISPHWASVQADLVRIVDLVPEGKIDWSPKEGLWNFRGILIHVSDARDQWLASRVVDGDPYPNIWTTARTKDDLKREMVRTYERLERFLANQSQLDAMYERDEEYGSRDGHWIAFHLLEHDIHHRAELMQRLAMLDVDHGLDF